MRRGWQLRAAVGSAGGSDSCAQVNLPVPGSFPPKRQTPCSAGQAEPPIISCISSSISRGSPASTGLPGSLALQSANESCCNPKSVMRTVTKGGGPPAQSCPAPRPCNWHMEMRLRSLQSEKHHESCGAHAVNRSAVSAAWSCNPDMLTSHNFQLSTLLDPSLCFILQMHQHCTVDSFTLYYVSWQYSGATVLGLNAKAHQSYLQVSL